jgi:hypothetical protein
MFVDMAASQEKERRAKIANPSFADALLKFRAAMSVAEGDDASHYAKRREGCSCFVGQITLVYDTAADYVTGKTKSAELEIEARQLHRRHHDRIYSIDLGLDSPLLPFGVWLGNGSNGDGEQTKTSEIDSDLLDALCSIPVK